jgi:hypothetical protein
MFWKHDLQLTLDDAMSSVNQIQIDDQNIGIRFQIE